MICLGGFSPFLFFNFYCFFVFFPPCFLILNLSYSYSFHGASLSSLDLWFVVYFWKILGHYFSHISASLFVLSSPPVIPIIHETI